MLQAPAGDDSISVLLCTFNGERFLPEMLASLAAQSAPPIELIVGDDGSTDGTLAILEAFTTGAPFPVTIVRQPHRLGFAENFLSLVGLTGSRYVAFADQDDVWSPTKLERIGLAVRRSGISLVIHQASLIDEAGRPLAARFPEIERSVIRRPLDIDPWFPAYGMTIVVDRAALEAATALGRPLSRDLDGHPLDHDEWAFLVGSATGRIALLAEPLTNYRQHPGNYIGAPRLGLIDRIARGLLHDEASYRSRQRLAESYAEFWERAADAGEVALPAQRCRMAATMYRRIAHRLGSRATALDRSVPLRHRVGSYIELLLGGGYAGRRRGGLGGRALIGDALRIAIPATRLSQRPVSDPVAQRIVEERGRGRSIEQIAEALDMDGVLPPYGRSWRPEMVRDVVVGSHIATEKAAIGHDDESGSSSVV